MSSVSLLEDGRLNEFYVEYGENNLITGNVYKGKVVNVLSGLQTAFVDIGVSRNAFLFVGEPSQSGAAPASALSVKEGDYCLVQVTKEETDSKGARISTELSLPGRYAVYIPDVDFIGVSGKITDPETREKLIKTLEKIRKPGEGLIARTASKTASKSDIAAEAKSLRALAADIKAAYKKADGIALIYSEGSLLTRTAREMINENTDALICNDPETAEALRADFKRKRSPLAGRVQLYEDAYDILQVYNIQAELDKLSERKVELPSGGSLVFDKTEALTVVDVNTAKFRGGADHEDAVFLTNMEAAREIARQLRLRNVGGIIVVDFIDMQSEAHKAAVLETLKAETATDRIRTRVFEMSNLGLVEITRKKVGNEVSAFLLDGCPLCGGSAHIHSAAYLARKIKAALKKLFADGAFPSALISLNPSFVPRMLSSRFFSAECEGVWADKRVYLLPDDRLPPQKFTVTGVRTQTINLPPDARLLY
jgi:ribonuclease G